MVVSTIVLCELAWVLKRAYRYRSSLVDCGANQQIIESRNVAVDRPAAEAGLRRPGAAAIPPTASSSSTQAEPGAATSSLSHEDFARPIGPGHCVLLEPGPRTSGRHSLSPSRVLHPPPIRALRPPSLPGATASPPAMPGAPWWGAAATRAARGGDKPEGDMHAAV